MTSNPANHLTRRRVLVHGAAASLGAATWPFVKATENLNDKEIRLGQTTALTGPLAQVAAPFTQGARACFEAVNQQGGVHGRRIVLTTVDDAYVPTRTVENVKALVEQERVLALFGVLGVATTAAALPVATQLRTPFLFPLNGDAVVRRTPNRYFFTCAASFADEVERLVQHLATIGGRKIAVAHLNNPFGNALREAAEHSVKQRGMSLVASAAFDLQGDKTAAARHLVTKAPDAVIVGAVGASAIEFIHAYRALAGSMILAISGLDTDAVMRQLGARGTGIVESQIVPFPWSPTVPVVREYQAVCKARGQDKLSHMGLWGHISARTVVEALRRAGGNVSREKLIDTLESMKKVDLGDYIVDFAPDKHHGSRFADITLLAATGKLVR